MTDADNAPNKMPELLDALAELEALGHALEGLTNIGDVKLIEGLAEEIGIVVPLVHEMIEDYTEAWNMFGILQRELNKQRAQVEDSVRRIITPADWARSDG